MLTSKLPRIKTGKRALILLLLSVIGLSAAGCRYDMQDQPRYKTYKKSDFFKDGRASRDLPAGTVPRGQLKGDKAFYTGKIANPDPNVAVTTTTDSKGNTLVSSFPNDIDEFPVPVTRELVDRGQERYNIYCIVCHGPVGKGDGMVARRGFPQPPTYHDDRLRNAPVGHFFDVITNGWGKMSSYAYQVPAADRWAIIAYIRTLQVSQNPDLNSTMTKGTNSSNTNTAAPHSAATPAAETHGGAR
jgi:mono/diheme cytochrome c family protein